MRNGFILLLLSVLTVAGSRAFAQQSYLSAFWGVTEDVRGDLSVAGESRHAAVLPMMNRQVESFAWGDSINDLMKMGKGKATSGVPSHNMLEVGKKKVRLVADPLVDLWGGYNSEGSRIFGGTSLGLRAQLDLGRKFTIGGTARFSQASFPAYVESLIRQRRIVPGGLGYAQASSLGGHYFWDGEVYANYEFLKYFNLEAGMGRNFWGDGYRSLFLSDQSFSYPNVKITTSVWKIKYVNLWGFMKDMQATSSGRWNRMDDKYGSFHFLSWDVSKRVNIGFFEAIIWQPDDTAAHRGFDVNYINPLIFFRPVEFAIGSPDNSLLGVSLKVKVGKKHFLYGQFLMDDIIIGEFTSGSLNRIRHWFGSSDSTQQYGFWTNKQAWQLGYSAYDLFRVKDLDIRLEYNAARPYTYSHRRSVVSYSHYNEPLAHPAGANFTEVLAFLRYRTGRWYMEGQLMYLLTGIDSAGTHYGQDVFQMTWDSYYPEYNNIPVQHYGNNIAQGIRQTTWYAAIRTAYVINSRMNLRAEAELSWRAQHSALADHSGIGFQLGLRTSAAWLRFDR